MSIAAARAARVAGARVRLPVPVPAQHAALFVVLMLATDIDFRGRDVRSALQGAVDMQVLLELALFAAAVLWTVELGLRRPGGWRNLDVGHALGTGTRLLLFIAFVSLLSVSYAPTPALALVKAVEYVLLAWMTAQALQVTRNAEGAARFWRAARRAVWALALGATTVSAAIPAYRAPLRLLDPHARYQWFATHPIATGGLIGLALVTLAASLLCLQDPWLERRRWSYLRGAVLAGLAVLLLATKARGALFAAAGGLAVLVLLAVHDRRRRLAVPVLLLTGAVLCTGVLVDEVREFVLRGQSTESFFTMTGRDRIFAHAWELFRERPITGHGYLAGRSLFLPSIPWAGESHNVLVEIATSLGLTGIVLYGVLLVVTARRLWRASRAVDLTMSAWGRESLALLTYIVLLGVVGEGFAGSFGAETVVLAWVVLAADAAGDKDESRPARPALARHVVI